MNGEEERSDTQLLLEARSCAEPFGAFYGPHLASVLISSGAVYSDQGGGVPSCCREVAAALPAVP